MEYLFYCRDRPGSAALREATAEAHRTFMDRYADGMIASGPTLTDDGVTATGSLHLVDLPSAEAARVFAFAEPNYRIGIYREVLICRWRNALGRDVSTAREGFLVLGHAGPGTTRTHDALLDHHQCYLHDGGNRQRLIAAGPMLSLDGSNWLGSVMLVDLPDRTVVDTMLADEPYLRCGLYTEVEIHRWQFGGRPDGQ